ncbi:ABC transporter substrate-binding protein [Williamsia sp. Leaf354]|jgi:peptide/nickel transport system substrate-binding protein|uniref:ABC transporter family substrate-binding protein n=1 Tax=Williamsia sp. Leaf354 TaxID=1736349 RepID=UPI0006FC9B30|nr:ABC transporter family substrate-binding protein [Williamsia sp. Leaf354]KQR96301.1 ABC transporter substrate-binding protein [Williamsia sp. Leaf354]
MKRQMFAVGAISVVATLALAGCGGSSSSSSSDTNDSLSKTAAQINAQPRDNIADGGKLTTALPEVSPQFNPFQADGTLYTTTLWRWSNPSLFTFSPDGTASADPDYLTGYSKAEVGGNTVVTYTINPKATFNDGTPIDWTAFEATWKTNNGSDPAYAASSTDGYSQIASVVQGTNSKQAVVTFRGTYAWPDSLFNIILHPKAANPTFYNTGYVNSPHPELGAGPYALKSFDKTSGTVIFERNPRWWGDAGKLDQRVFLQMDSQASINAFKNGQIDAVSARTKDRLAQVQGVGGTQIRKSATPSQDLATLNLASPPLRDIKVRSAILKAINRKVVADVLFQGLGYSETLPGSFGLYPFQKGYADNVKGVIDFDTSAAKSELDSAGWVTGGDGIRTKDGQKLSLSFPLTGDDPTILNLARAIQAMEKSVGVDLQIQQKSSSEFSDVVTNKKFDFFLSGVSSSDPFGYAYFCQFWCSGSQLNQAGAGTPELDKQIRAVGEIADPAAQIAAGNTLERTLLAQYSNLPLDNGPTIVATKEKLANYGAGLFYIGRVQDIGYQK